MAPQPVFRRQRIRIAAKLSVGKRQERRGWIMTGRRLTLALVTSLLSTAILASQALAQGYPSRLVRVIVPFGAGGPADVTARKIGSILQESFGQPFVIEN